MSGGGEEEVWLAQGEALRDPRPDVPHLLYGDNLRGEVVRIESQLHILSVESKEIAQLSSNIMIEHLVLLMYTKTLQKRKKKKEEECGKQRLPTSNYETTNVANTVME